MAPKRDTIIHLPAEIAERYGIPRSEARKLLAQGRILINGRSTTDVDLEFWIEGSCPCGEYPDPGIKPEGGCYCSEVVASNRKAGHGDRD